VLFNSPLRANIMSICEII